MSLKGNVVAAATMSLLCAILLNPTSAKEIDSYVHEKIKTAKKLYDQYKHPIAELRLAAETGDAESQFYLAEELRGPSGIMTPEAMHWYEKAAIQGDLYAMFRLATSDSEICTILQNCPSSTIPPRGWKAKLIELASLKSAGGDSQAMSIMYNATGKLEWLEQSAAAGNPEAQWLLANHYFDGQGFFWPGRRMKEVERLLKLSADGGHPKGMMDYSGWLANKGRIEEGVDYLLKAVDMSYALAVESYAYSLMTDTSYNLEKDVVKSYGLFSLLLELDGGGTSKNDAAFGMRKLGQVMTSSEIKDALIYAEGWRRTHRPLTFYPTKLGL